MMRRSLFLLACAVFILPSLPVLAAGTQETFSPNENDATDLPLPDFVVSPFFIGIDTDILRDIEIGSPASIRRAAARIRKSNSDYSDAEKTALAICAGLMQIAWSSESINWEIPEVSQQNPYIAALTFAKQGIYDDKAGNADFLTLVIPTLALLSPDATVTQSDKADANLNTALAMRPESVLVRYVQGILFRRKNLPEKALPCFERAHTSDPLCFEIATALAQTYFELGRIKDAELVAAKLAQAKPRDIAVLKLYTEIAFALGDTDTAEKYIARILQIEPNNTYFMLLHIRILIVTNSYIKASSQLDAYARIDSTSRDYFLLRAQIQRDWNKNIPAAAETIEQALALYPTDAEVVLFAAELASMMNRSINGKTATELVQELLRAEPDNVYALTVLVTDAASRQDWNAAYNYSTQIIQKGSAPPEVYVARIEACIAFGRIAEGRQLATAVRGAYPDREDVLRAYIKVCVANGEYQEARALIASYITRSSSDMKSFLYWQRSRLASNEDGKLSDLRKSLTSNPRNADSLFELYQYYFDLNDYRKAQYYLKQVAALSPENQRFITLSSQLEQLLANE